MTWTRVIWTLLLWAVVTIGGMFAAARIADWLLTP